MLNELLNNKYRIDFPVRWNRKGNNKISICSYQTDKIYDFILDEQGTKKITLKNFVQLLKETDIKSERGLYEKV
jgi:hypothetical protein|tara:strand:+ start:202 stop:423 length:222 start_codon:yes stop_codon:yes gene_type:complete